MNWMKGLAAMAMVGALAWTSTQVGAQDNTAREARDRAEIEALMWSYTRALDTLNPDAYAAAYTPDGQFVAGQNATKGQAALKKMIVDTNERQTARRQGRGAAGDVSHDPESEADVRGQGSCADRRVLLDRVRRDRPHRAGTRGRSRPQRRSVGPRQRQVAHSESRRRAQGLSHGRSCHLVFQRTRVVGGLVPGFGVPTPLKRKRWNRRASKFSPT